jgi:hypothetical protein
MLRIGDGEQLRGLVSMAPEHPSNIALLASTAKAFARRLAGRAEKRDYDSVFARRRVQTLELRTSRHGAKGASPRCWETK